MQFNTRVDLLEDNDALSQSIVNNHDTRYVLVVPEGLFSSDDNLTLDDRIDSINNMLGDTLHSVVFYEDSQDRISLTLTELPRMWHYLQIAPL
jgi:hypothetical protein